MSMAAINIKVERISHLPKLVSSQIIANIAITGITNPHGALKYLSSPAIFFLRSLMVAKTTAR